jgi:hypothetical protein
VVLIISQASGDLTPNKANAIGKKIYLDLGYDRIQPTKIDLLFKAFRLKKLKE